MCKNITANTDNMWDTITSDTPWTLFTNTSLSPESNLIRIRANHSQLLPLCDTACAWFVTAAKIRHAGNRFIHRFHLYLHFVATLKLTAFRQILEFRIWWNSVQWEPRCSIRTDMTKLTVAFCSFARASKNRPVSDTAVTTARGVSTFTCLSLE
jgi:hypothetical protein